MTGEDSPGAIDHDLLNALEQRIEQAHHHAGLGEYDTARSKLRTVRDIIDEELDDG